MRIVDADFRPLDTFPLAFRWTQSTHANLPESTLRHIRPFTADRAAELNALAAKLCLGSRVGARVIAADGPTVSVGAALAGLLTTATPIIVSWSAELAVLTEWQIFVQHWDDFCYPSSDDVTIIPLDHAWSLCYDHYEQFRFWSTGHPSP